MSRLPARHGRDQRLGGYDPIPPGRWIYVGDYPADPDTTADSPPFQNSWSNAGGGDRRLRFRRDNENNTQIAGSVTGGVAGTVVTTLPELYRVTEDEFAAGVNDGGIFAWKFATTGELTMLGSITFDSGGDLDLLKFIGWGSNTDVDASGLTLTTADDLIGVIGGVFSFNIDDQADMVIGGNTTFSMDTTKVSFRVGPAGTFTVYDSSLNPILQITDGSPDIHIPTGGNIVADL